MNVTENLMEKIKLLISNNLKSNGKLFSALLIKNKSSLMNTVKIMKRIFSTSVELSHLKLSISNSDKELTKAGSKIFLISGQTTPHCST